MTKEQKKTLYEQFVMMGQGEDFAHYCTNKVSEIAELPNGEILTVEKQSIETYFCFGESGDDYEQAVSMANHARTSEVYFKYRNMEYYRNLAEGIRESMNGSHRLAFVICTGKLDIPNPDDCRIHTFCIERVANILASSGLYNPSDITGNAITIYGKPYRTATKIEHELMLDAIEKAAKKHEKKIDNYLKRYGLSKVHSWTYWRDA